mgnify:FL=1|jgi:hypothetical protein
MIFLSITLFHQFSYGQTAVYLDGFESKNKLNQNNYLPNWLDETYKKDHADWIIKLETNKSSKSKIINSIAGAGTMGVLMALVGLINSTISTDTDRKDMVRFSFWLGATVGFFGGLNTLTLVELINMSILNTHTGEKNFFSYKSQDIKENIEKTIRKMAGDKKPPTISIKNFKQLSKSTVKRSVIDIDLEISDDVGLSYLEYNIGNNSIIKNNIIVKGTKTYTTKIKIPLELGENILTIFVKDIYGRSERKTFPLTRIRDFGIDLYAKGSENLNNKTSPALLRITDVAFQDEENDGFLDAGESGSLSFSVINEGKSPAGEIVINLQFQKNINIDITPKEEPISIKSGAKAEYWYSFIAGSNISTQHEKLNISVSDKATKSSTLSQNIVIKTRGLYSDVDVNIPELHNNGNNTIAVIFGISNYKYAPSADFADIDAQIFYKYIKSVFGVPERNIFLGINENATKGEFDKIFSNNGWIKRHLEPGISDIIFYYSGHGAPDIISGEGYLIPYDTDPNYATTGYNVNQIYTSLAGFDANSITIYIDACFSGISRDNEMLVEGMRPISIEIENSFYFQDNVTISTASTGTQYSSSYPEKAHGLFTYYLLKGLQGEANNNDNILTVGELHKYMNINISKTARNLDLEQTPMFIVPNPDIKLVRY